MPYNATIVFTTGAVLSAGQLNNQIGTGGNMDQTAVAIVTTAGDIVYATGSKALARLGIGAGTTVLHGGASVPSWSQVVDADIAAAAAVAQSKLARTQRCKLTQTPASITSSTDTAYGWDGEVEDPDGWHAAAAVDILPTRNAVVLVMARIAWAGNATGRRILRLEKDLAEFATREQPSPGAGNWVQDVQGYTLCDGATNKLRLYVYQDSGGALSQYSGGANVNAFEAIALPGVQ